MPVEDRFFLPIASRHRAFDLKTEEGRKESSFRYILPKLPTPQTRHVAPWLGRAYQQDAGSRLLFQHVRFPLTFALLALYVLAVVKPVDDISVPILVFLRHSP